mmetsp:Transcript_13996/g.16989  ORF Transcript_13996/g.16989 Transcript_13996/m.16989 type:complete len:403 (+) Transcript_13996:186-1394(+)
MLKSSSKENQGLTFAKAFSILVCVFLALMCSLYAIGKQANSPLGKSIPISFLSDAEEKEREEKINSKVANLFTKDEKKVELGNKLFYEQNSKERPINLAFFHDPDTAYGKVGTVLLLNSMMKYATEPEHIMFHIILESEEKRNSTLDLVRRMKKAFPKIGMGTGGTAIHVQKENPQFNQLFRRVKFRSSLCRRRKVLMHHFCLPDTLPQGIGKIIMLDTDMMLQNDITILWDLVARQLDDEHVVAAHKNCKQPYRRYFKQVGVSKVLLPDREYALAKDQCSYDNGLTALNMDSPMVRNMVNATLEMVMNDKIFNNLRYVACTRDMMNLVFAKNYGVEGIPSEWMLGGACYKGKNLIEKSNLVHFSGGKKIWYGSCSSRDLLHEAKRLCKNEDKSGLTCESSF